MQAAKGAVVLPRILKGSGLGEKDWGEKSKIVALNG